MELHIRDMVCVRCKMAVATVLNDLNIAYKSIELGKVVLEKEITENELSHIRDGLASFELYLIKERKEILVEKIKTSIIEIFRSEEFDIPTSFTSYLTKRLYYDYTHLSNIFSEVEGSTIERYYIMSRLNRAKELIIREELTLTEIAHLLRFSSVSHLCIQFKKITGKTASEFKRMVCQ